MEISKADWKMFRERVPEWQMIRSIRAIWDIAIFIKKKVITIKELEGFSQELIDSVTEILNR